MNLIPLTSDQPLIIPLWAVGEIDTTGWDQPKEITFLQDDLKIIRNNLHDLSLATPLRI